MENMRVVQLGLCISSSLDTLRFIYDVDRSWVCDLQCRRFATAWERFKALSGDVACLVIAEPKLPGWLCMPGHSRSHRSWLCAAEERG